MTSPAPCHPVSSRTVMPSEWHLHPLARTCVNTCFNLTPNQLLCWAERFSAQLNSKAWTEIPRLFHNTFFNFKLFFQIPRDHPSRTIYHWYHRYFHVPQFFKIQELVYLFACFHFHSKMHKSQFFSSCITLDMFFGKYQIIHLYLKMPENCMRLILRDGF